MDKNTECSEEAKATLIASKVPAGRDALAVGSKITLAEDTAVAALLPAP